MGTDIHLGVERLNNGKWEEVVDLFPNHEQIMGAYNNFRSEDPALREPALEVLNNMPTHRDYDLFAMLANVRNGVGFGGVKRGEPVTPLFADRGRPENTCFALHDGDHWLGGYHSFTWCTYNEAMAAPWTRAVVTHAVVDFDEWIRWQESDAVTPQMWSQGVAGGNTRIVDESEAKKIRESGDSTDGVYVQTYWEWRPLADSSFRRWLLSPKFQETAKRFGGDNLRICMSFDS